MSQPIGLRARAKAAIKRPLRPFARRAGRFLLNAALDEHLDQPYPHPDPAKRLTRFEQRMTRFLMTSEFTPAKHNPVRPFEKHYLLPKPTSPEIEAATGLPIPPPEVRVKGYGETTEHYLQIGQRHIRRMRAILAQHGRDLRMGDNILDLGCSCGPMIRYLHTFAEKGEVWGTDIVGDHITWAMQNLQPPFRFLMNNSAAHLPFEDRTFDLIYCGSVFSHMGETANAWLAELARILRPGGTLYATYVPKEAMWNYINHWPTLEFSQSIQKHFTREQLESDFDALVLDRSQYLHAVYDRAYFHRACATVFDVIEDRPGVYAFQHALVLSKRAPRRAKKPQALHQPEGLAVETRPVDSTPSQA